MTTKVPSDEALLDLNRAIFAALKDYVDDAVDIRFDLPDPESPPVSPTLSVFLYDIYEDLQLRTAESRQYSATGSVLLPGRVNVCCNYLLMYWNGPAVEGGPGGDPVNQTVIIMNQVLNALINNRQLEAIPGAFTRVIPPKEELNSLGNFWQALGNRPRLVLNYAATVSVSQTVHPAKDTVSPVSVTEQKIDQDLSKPAPPVQPRK